MHNKRVEGAASHLPVMESPTSGWPVETNTISEVTTEEGSVDEMRSLTEVTFSWDVSELKEGSSGVRVGEGCGYTISNKIKSPCHKRNIKTLILCN